MRRRAARILAIVLVPLVIWAVMLFYPHHDNYDAVFAQQGNQVVPNVATGGTLDFPVTGTGIVSGAIPCGTSTTALTMGAILNTNILVKGGGAGACPTNSLITDNGTTATYTGTGGYSAPIITSTVTTGTPPLTVTSTTPVANLAIGGASGGAPWSGITNGTNAQTGAFSTAAPWTFSVAGAASVPGVTISGTPFVGTGTTSFPQLYMNGGTAPTTWNSTATGGTYLGINSIASFAGNFMDLHVNGGASVMNITSAGRGNFIGLTSSSFLEGATINNYASGRLIYSGTAPTVASGFGTSPSIPNSNGTFVFTVNVGTGGVATSGVITMPTATTGWGCNVTPNGAPQAAAVTYSAPTSTTSITLTNYTESTGAALAWTASTVLQVQCLAY